MRNLFTILLITISGLTLFAQDNNISKIKIKILVDSLKKVDTVIQISSNIDHDEIQRMISEITEEISDYDFIYKNMITSDDSLFNIDIDVDIDVDVDVDGIDEYVDSVFKKEFDKINFDFEFSNEFEEEAHKSLNKHIIIKKSEGQGEDENIIIIRNEDGKEEKIIIRSDDIQKYSKDSDIEREDDNAVK